MATATATGRVAAPSRVPAGDRPRLQVVGPPRRRRASWPVRAPLAVAVALILGSLLLVAGAQAYLTQQSVRLGQVQTQLAVQVGEHRNLELRVAQLSNPSHVVSAARHQGLTVPNQITDLPQVTVPPTATAHRAHRGKGARASGHGGT
jgi:cell division protein FtsL